MPKRPSGRLSGGCNPGAENGKLYLRIKKALAEHGC